MTIAPRTPRVVIFLLWCLVASLIPYMVTTLPAHPWLTTTIALATGVALIVFGAVRCSSLQVRVDAEGLAIQNVFTTQSWTWAAIDAITLRRFGSRRAVDEEALSTVPRFFSIYGIRFPGVAVRSRDGRLSSPATVTMLIGPKARAALLDCLSGYVGASGVSIAIRSPNRGWLCGLSWDITRATGIQSAS
jgi:hypothetical protein